MSAFAVADEQIAHLRIERVLAIQAERPAHDGPLTSHDSTPARRPALRRIHCDRPFRFCCRLSAWRMIWKSGSTCPLGATSNLSPTSSQEAWRRAARAGTRTVLYYEICSTSLGPKRVGQRALRNKCRIRDYGV